jgi:multidrug transporter EmrE-like cation transporter
MAKRNVNSSTSQPLLLLEELPILRKELSKTRVAISLSITVFWLGLNVIPLITGYPILTAVLLGINLLASLISSYFHPDKLLLGWVITITLSLNGLAVIVFAP